MRPRSPHAQPSQSASSPAPRAALARRDFLKLVAATTAAAGVAPLLGGLRRVAAQRPQAVKVLVEDLPLGPADLARGRLQDIVAAARGLALAPGSARGEYTSPVLTGSNPFTHIGVHWLGGPDLAFAVRSSVDGAAWSDWHPVLVDDHGAAPGSETFGSLVAADRATRVQFRAVFSPGAHDPSLQSATVTLLNAKDGPAITSLADAPATPDLTTGGAVYSREDWGCDESLGLDSNGNPLWPQMYVPVKKAFVHHTVTTNNYSTVEDAKAEVRAVYVYHAKTQGWGDIGYNALVDKWGNVYEGRRGRGAGSTREVLSPGVVAGHTLKHNYGSTGVALLGTFTKKGEGGQPGVPPSDAMKTGLVDVLAWECGRHDLNPETLSDFLLSSDEWNDAVHNISGHRDGYPFVSTVCPGGYVYDLLPTIRTDVASRLLRASPSIGLVAPSVQTVPLGTVESQAFSWSSSDGSGEFRYLLEGWRRQPNSEAIDYISGADAARYPAWLQTTQTEATFGALFDVFKSTTYPDPVPGHYTFHVLALDASGKLSYQRDHTLLVAADGDATPPPAAIALTATGYKLKGAQHADLTWSGATTSQVTIRRKDNGGAWNTIATVTNTAGTSNTYTDNIGKRGGGTYTYQVCEVGTDVCSNEATVTF